ncbi:hypothetical protein MVQ26_10515 [Fusobacterium necrophorum]|uniref:hypothetical protein n=1 Tax=Fusobacterium necrophorum TaxID=859 RepID=UPI0007888495|nr:hypothetical protein [Fusobacterium necrophorum]KYM54860.1 hypothetical protein A2U07_03455 [Fusobacterium necrophorum subsp. funduliforme]MDK4473559.1 hypothetical protein [Fusobacterium necrophorum]MDK4482124.1 hypothetical protein [Fusobacterium necrophorum]MDK4484970.1 hypothetical protein [Fusobacterium necrophorum]MDK4488164.1 hypothetical protein [Fusobacterium necrophorum]
MLLIEKKIWKYLETFKNNLRILKNMGEHAYVVEFYFKKLKNFEEMYQFAIKYSEVKREDYRILKNILLEKEKENFVKYVIKEGEKDIEGTFSTFRKAHKMLCKIKKEEIQNFIEKEKNRRLEEFRKFIETEERS